MMWHWLNTNASAVQAIAALVTGVLTIILVGLTRFYALETQSMRRTAQDQFNLAQRQFIVTEKQFAIALHPKLSLRISYDYSHWQIVRYHIKNVGSELVVVKEGFIHIRWPYNSGLAYVPISIPALSQMVLVPDDELDREFDFGEQIVNSIEKYGSINEAFLRIALFVNCSDLGDVGNHCFSRDSSGIARFYPYYYRPEAAGNYLLPAAPTL